HISHITSLCECTSVCLGVGTKLHPTTTSIDDDDDDDECHDGNPPQNNTVDRYHQTTTKTTAEMISGWEGPAILRHGSVIQFGCYKFVFGLIDLALPPHPPSNNLDSSLLPIGGTTTNATTITEDSVVVSTQTIPPNFLISHYENRKLC
ncbi:unnamed protein product, partial [Trichobilharzia regenti]